MNEDRTKIVVSVGQCGYDNSRIRSLILEIQPTARFVATDTADETLELIDREGDKIALVLLNRLFDEDGDRGVDLIRSIHTGPAQHKPALMLVSNYEAAQAEAIAFGALPGFGKSELRAAETRERIAAVLG